jgi:medium-chain acyl-[acyl-carrier-protein] hydrolase
MSGHNSRTAGEEIKDADSALWIRRPRPQPDAAARLFCFSCAGGTAALYQPWAADMRGAIEVCAIEMPGRGVRLREPPLTSVHDAVGGIADALEPELDRPYALFGHSLGALMAFEVAHELRRRGAPAPLLLFASARRAPHLSKRTGMLHMLTDAGLAGYLRELNGTPAGILADAEVMALVLPVVRADLAADETYVVPDRPLLDIPIHAFGGTTDPTLLVEELTAWGLHTLAEATVTIFPGDHFFIKTARRDVINWVAGALAAAGMEPRP